MGVSEGVSRYLKVVAARMVEERQAAWRSRVPLKPHHVMPCLHNRNSVDVQWINPFYLRSTGMSMFPRAPPDIKMPFAMARRRLK